MSELAFVTQPIDCNFPVATPPAAFGDNVNINRAENGYIVRIYSDEKEAIKKYCRGGKI